jgi:hypothetical protein
MKKSPTDRPTLSSYISLDLRVWPICLYETFLKIVFLNKYSELVDSRQTGELSTGHSSPSNKNISPSICNLSRFQSQNQQLERCDASTQQDPGSALSFVLTRNRVPKFRLANLSYQTHSHKDMNYVFYITRSNYRQ